LDHRDDLATAGEGLDTLTAEGYLIIIKEFPLLESHQNFSVYALKVTILRGMFETELLGLIQYVFHEIVFLSTVGTFTVPLLCRLVLLLFIDKGIFIITVLVLFFLDLFCDRFLSWS